MAKTTSLIEELGSSWRWLQREVFRVLHRQLETNVAQDKFGRDIELEPVGQYLTAERYLYWSELRQTKLSQWGQKEDYPPCWEA